MRPYSIVERTGEGNVPKTTEFGTTEKSPALLKHLAQVENSELSGESGSKMMQPSKVLRKGRRAHRPRKTIASAQLPTWGNHSQVSVSGTGLILVSRARVRKKSRTWNQEE